MFSVLLAVIYLSYISLGLPDSLPGAAWPSMQQTLGVPMSCAGVLSAVISLSTVFSGLMADRLLRRFGTGPVAAESVLLTAAAMSGYSAAGHFVTLCILAVPYGLGAGAVDAALNHYVAVHYPARHMSWLHCFWGIGAAASPYIMSFHLRRGADWQGGYRTVAAIQLLLTVMLFCALPLWKPTAPETAAGANASAEHIPLKKLLRRRGVRRVLLMFFCSSAFESTAGLWASSFLVTSRGLRAETAAQFASCYYIGITAGRLAGGFFADRLGDLRMIRIGLCGAAAGTALLLAPHSSALACCGLIVTGFGAAPVYPCLLHRTPAAFPGHQAQQMIGLQIAAAYTGTTVMPALAGRLAACGCMRYLPAVLTAFPVLLLCMTLRPAAEQQPSADTDCSGEL